jgi:methylase of polypeptide subunit release factors
VSLAEKDYFPGLDDWNPAPLQARLRRGGFHHETLEGLGLPEHWLRSKISRAALLGHVNAGAPIDTLIRLFTLGDEVEGVRVLEVLGETAHALLKMGFLTASGGGMRSRFQICPVGASWIACDFPERQLDPAADHVMGLGPSTMLLASLTPPGNFPRVLELGCGIGWLSQELARAGKSVVASDLNPRAIALGRFSRKLSGAPAVDFRCGDGFATVAGERFDLIVANPPYVQSPGGPLLYREAPEGDPICARLLRSMREHLVDGGIGVLLLNWMHRNDEDWAEAPLSWLPETGMRRWLFQTDCSSPVDYAWKWIERDPRFEADADAASEEIARWLAYYRSKQIERISGGFFIVQRCEAGKEWTRTDSRAASEIATNAGADLLRTLKAENWLLENLGLLEARFTVPEGVRADVAMVLREGGWQRETIRLKSPGLLSYDGQIDENILRLLELTREGKTAAVLLAELRGNPDFAAMEGLDEKITGLVEELLRHGMLVPAENRS